jgi:2-keto-4-pentenoate hydratase/2-oxohepta-3-ene-1,7-dioic acid hydratase in catechol pathway
MFSFLASLFSRRSRNKKEIDGNGEQAKFRRLIRFQDASGSIRYGEAPETDKLIGKVVPVYAGEDPWSLRTTGKFAEVAEVDIARRDVILGSWRFKVLCPLPTIPIMFGVGLNYKRHIKETGSTTPTFPVLFTKAQDALAGPFDDIRIPKECQSTADYEVRLNTDAEMRDTHSVQQGELTIIINRDCKNISTNEEAYECILGYTVGNDVSARHWQDAARSGGQASFSKSFDRFGPIGPVIVAPSEIPDPTNLLLETRVDGALRQSGKTDDLLFNIPEILKHMTLGTTLRRGTVIMTGTPSGVGMAMKPPGWVKDGEVVEVEIEKIGKIRNKYVFERY